MSKVLLTGGSGFLGQYVFESLIHAGYDEEQIFVPRSSQYDLRYQNQVSELFSCVKPKYVIHLAASVGGIGANMANPGKFFYDNAIMGINLIEESRINECDKFVLVGTVCAYPKVCPIPFTEDYLWYGYPEETNAPYGIAKKALGVMLKSYEQQYNLAGSYLLPANLYGPRDNFDVNSSHVIPALIQKIVYAKKHNLNEVVVWGDGSATREFLYVKDAAEAIVKSVHSDTGSDPINIGNGTEVSIKKLVEYICDIVDYGGNIVWDSSKPNGQPRRCLDTKKSKKLLNWTAKTNLHKGLTETIDWYMSYAK